MQTKTKEADEIVFPQSLIDQINSIVPGSPVEKIGKPSFVARFFGNTASNMARLLIWLDTSIYSMLCWWGGAKVSVLQLVFHAACVAGLLYRFQSQMEWWQAVVVVVCTAVVISLPIQFMLYAFEFSLMGKNEKKIGSFRETFSREISNSDGVVYSAGLYDVGVYHERPTMMRCAMFWPICLFFVITECLAHYLLVFRDHALGNKYGSFVLLPEDWVEFYKEVPKSEYTGFVPEHFTRRLDQVLKDHQGEVFVLVPFGIMPGHSPEVDAIEHANLKWQAHLVDLQRPQGDPVLAVRLNDETRYGRMLVVGHWLTIATLQKFNLLFHEFGIEPVKIGY